MNSVDQLLEKLAPSGVERISLGSVITNLRTGLNPRQNFVLNSPGSMNHYVTVRELGGFKLRITDKTDKVDNEALALIQRRAQIVVGDVLFSGTGTIGNTALVEEPPLDWSVKEGVYIITPDSKSLNSKFLIYLLRSTSIRRQMLNKAEGSTVASLSMASLREISILLPPIDVQHEIVRVLDTFTQLEAELEAELEARKKQYEHYRKSLLIDQTDVKTFPLRDIADFTNAKAHEKLVDPTGDIALITSKFISTRGNSARYVKKEDVLTPAFTNDIALVMSDLPNGRALAKTFFVENDNKYAANQRVCLLRTKDSERLSPRYLYQFLNRNPQLLAYDNGTDQTHLKKNYILDVQVALPSLERQNEILGILDDLEILVEDLGRGLPAEIQARRKQYEYYRDKLLTFKELAQ